MKRTILLGTLLTLCIPLSSLAAEKVLAVVNGKKITEKELNERINSLPPNFNALKKNPQFRKMMLENMVREELLYQEALKEGIDKLPQVKKEIEMAKKQIIINNLLKKKVKVPKVKVSDEEARKFYEENKSRFTANGKTVPFSQLKPFIIESLRKQKEQKVLQEAVNNYIKSLEKENKVKIEEEK